MTESAQGALDGIKVVEFAQNAAIPHCGRLLAGVGADVVKVEPPGGDAMRRLAGLGREGSMESRAFALINPGKRGIVIDLQSPKTTPVVEALFRWADVALTAFKLPDLTRYGIDWDTARQINPQLIHVTHSPLGPEGPDADLGGYDALVQGRSGVGFIMNRSGATAPKPTRPAVNDFGSGFSAAFAVVAALRHRDRTGEGQRIDTSLLGTAISLGTPLLGSFDQDAEQLAELEADIAAVRSAGGDFDTQRAIYESKVQAGAGAFLLYFRHYQTADGLVSLAGLAPGLFDKFHEATGIDRPPGTDITEPAFHAVVQQAEELFASRTTAEWLELLRNVGYPCGPYNMPHEGIRDPHAEANGYVVDLDHPEFGGYRTADMPFQMEKSQVGVPGPSPRFGADTADVMAEIGLDADFVASLLDSGAILDGPDDG